MSNYKNIINYNSLTCYNNDCFFICLIVKRENSV